MAKTYTLRVRMTKRERDALKRLATRQQHTLSEVVGIGINLYWRALGRPNNAVFKEPGYMRGSFVTRARLSLPHA